MLESSGTLNSEYSGDRVTVNGSGARSPCMRIEFYEFPSKLITDFQKRKVHAD